MNIISFIIILFFIEYFPINCSNNQSLPSSINYYFKDRFARYFNSSDDYISSSTNRIQTLDISYNYNTIKDVSTLTKTQIRVIITAVFIISFIMLIIAIFRFKNACRTQETDHLQTDIIRNRASQYSEPSSRRGSVGYYTQRYNRPTSIRFDDQLNISLPPIKRLSIPACDQSSKSTAVIVSSSSPINTTVTTDDTHHHHVTSSCDTSNTSNQQISIDTKPVIYKLSSTIGINQCDDQTPLLTSELTSTIKDSSNHTTRKYSLNALLPLVRPSTSHPFCSSLTSTIAGGIVGDNGNGIDLKSRRRVSLSSAIRRSSFAKQPSIFCSTIDSLTTNKTASPPILPIDSDSSDQTSLLSNKPISSKTQHRKKTSTIRPIKTTTTSSSSYPKDFMHKIERFRFIDDSASSTTTVTSPVESVERVNSHLITSAIEQFDDYVRTQYSNDDDDVNSLIECLDSDLLINGSYSDLNILNNHSSSKTILRPQTFKPVNDKFFQTNTNLSGCQQNQYRQSIPINIPHSITSLPLQRQRNQIETNGHSRSMDFQSISNRRDRNSTINETSSSSTATLTSIRSSTSLEFDDNTKPSGVLVDDDFLPMSSPVDEHFWNMTIKNYYGSNNNECFPNVGSSPDIEIKHFDLQKLNTLSETSCDEDDNDDDSTSSNSQPELFSINELPKPFVIIKSNISEEIIPDKSESDPSINSTEQVDLMNNPTLLSSDQINDQSLLEKFSSSIRSDFLCETISHSNPIFEEDDTQESSPNDDASEGDDSADNGEIDLAQEFELSQKEEQTKTNNLWSINDHDVYVIQEDDLISEFNTTPTINRNQPTSIMKITNTKTIDSIDEQQQQQQALKPKVRFNLDPQYEREREWNKVNKLLGNSVEWTDEFEV